MKKKERTFCLLVSQGKSFGEAAILAGYRDEFQGTVLISRSDIVEEIIKITDNKLKLMKSLAVLGYEHLAFGGVSDCISLISQENITDSRLKNMDLFLISEIKKPKDGAIEIKFFDRLKALEKLESASNIDEKGSLPFYEALERSAVKLGERNEQL